MIVPMRTDYMEADPTTGFASDFEVFDKGLGKLTLSVIDARTGESKELKYRGNPWSAVGFSVHLWSAQKLLVLAGHERISVIPLSTLEPIVSLVLELEEVKTLDEPVVVSTNDALLIGTDSRLLCVLAPSLEHWIWSARAHTVEWCGISGTPSIEGGRVHVSIEGPKVFETVKLDLRTGTRDRTP